MKHYTKLGRFCFYSLILKTDIAYLTIYLTDFLMDPRSSISTFHRAWFLKDKGHHFYSEVNDMRED